MEEVVDPVVGWCEFSAQLFSPLCFLCSTDDITLRLAAR